MTKPQYMPGSMDPKRWAYLKQLDVSEPKLLHKSCDAYMLPNPVSKHLPDVPFCTSNRWQRDHGVRFKSTSGMTYNVGRNAQKRARRHG